ncbi:class I SAM-dependent methyltransferase [Sphingomonas sp. ST-64]|uniref:Class I SAM-dependent methyltransferase n=1 Tax=Sphingomonas plantiphila TaxID=3163295 RepID=A0ABW8YJ13_9SPHN
MFNIAFLDTLRVEELQLVVGKLKPRSRVLEFGAGTGSQARDLAQLGFDVVAIDLATSGYSGERVFDVIDYDGLHIPLPDQSVDAIFSSNVLEHVEDTDQIFREFARVLRPDGFCVHLLPSVAWRAWTFVTGVPTAVLAAAQAIRDPFLSTDDPRRKSFRSNLKTVFGSLLPIGHGTSFEGISELWTFSRHAWRSKFRNAGFVVEEVHPVGLFHTGHMLAGKRLPIAARRRLAAVMGSAANVFVIRPGVRG